MEGCLEGEGEESGHWEGGRQEMCVLIVVNVDTGSEAARSNIYI